MMAPQPEAVQLIPFRELRRAPWNARKTFDEASLAELRASIEQHGVQVPLIVRPIEAMQDILRNSEAAAASPRAFEIVCGHRRFEAALMADQMKVRGVLPCFIREMGDEQAREIGLVDNLQRLDVPAMEEAQAFADLFDRMGSVQAVAARVGKEQGYVAKRLKLRTLTLSAQDALREKLITIDHALLLARLGEDEQAGALKWCLDCRAGFKTPVEKVIDDRLESERRKRERQEEGGYYPYKWEPQSAAQLKLHIEHSSGVKLGRAPWPLEEDWLLPDVGSCLVCPQNTTANAPLFGDLDIGEPTCTDGGCFRAKTQAFVLHGIETAKKDGAKLPILRVSWTQTSTAPRQAKEGGPNPAQTFKNGQWVEAKKKCPHARVAVTVDWSDEAHHGYGPGESKQRKPGETVEVCVEPKCKAHPKSYAKPEGNPADRPRNENAAEARTERDRKEAAANAENALRAEQIKLAIAGVKALSGALLRHVVLCALPEWMDPDARKMFPDLEKGLKTLKVDSPEFARAASCLLFLDSHSNYWADEYRPVEAGRKELLALLKDMGHDASRAWAVPAAPKKAAAKPATKAPKAAKKKALAELAKRGGDR